MDCSAEHTAPKLWRMDDKKTTNENSLFRNKGYIETDYNKLRLPYYIMQQLVKQITLFIMVNSTKLILKKL